MKHLVIYPRDGAKPFKESAAFTRLCSAFKITRERFIECFDFLPLVEPDEWDEDSPILNDLADELSLNFTKVIYGREIKNYKRVLVLGAPIVRNILACNFFDELIADEIGVRMYCLPYPTNKTLAIHNSKNEFELLFDEFFSDTRSLQ